MATADACSKVRFAGLGASLFSGARVSGEGSLADADGLVGGPQPGDVLADRLHDPGPELENGSRRNGALTVCLPEALDDFSAVQRANLALATPVHEGGEVLPGFNRLLPMLDHARW
jgi:hypothetical protein